MLRIATIVEGKGEVEAVPILLRRIGRRLRPNLVLDLPRPIRVPRDRVVKSGQLERAIELAALRAGQGGRILVLLDAETDCPGILAPQLVERARETRPDRDIRVVLAKTEYECWFLAAASSVAGRREINTTITTPENPESIRDAKGWLSARMPPGRSYRPTLDQAALTARFDLDAARAAPSFDKLWRDVATLLAR